MSVEFRFWSKVSIGKPAECWNWLGSKDQKGYGHFWVEGQVVKAHRYIWENLHGNIPNGMVICHKCDNPSCCNPKHLMIGSLLDNNRDMDAKGRRCDRKGEKSARAKLTNEEVKEIRRLYLPDTRGNVSMLCDKFHMSRGAIRAIIERASWRHI